MTAPPVIRRAGYALALLVLGLPLFPFWIIGYDDCGESGYFRECATGLIVVGLIAISPVLVVVFGLKWVLTGRGFSA